MPERLLLENGTSFLLREDGLNATLLETSVNIRLLMEDGTSLLVLENGASATLLETGLPVSHAATGALVGQIGYVSGAASRISGASIHDATGVLTGQIGSVSGVAARFRAHDATGALSGQIGSISGAASRAKVHYATGALVGQAGSVTGTAARARVHAATGALVGSVGFISGIADGPLWHNGSTTSGTWTTVTVSVSWASDAFAPELIGTQGGGWTSQPSASGSWTKL